jgi:hypothetical protein
LCCGDGGRGDDFLDGGVGEGCPFCGLCEPAHDVGFVAVHVGFAGSGAFAGELVGDGVREEDFEGLCEEALGAGAPEIAAVGLGFD